MIFFNSVICRKEQPHGVSWGALKYGLGHSGKLLLQWYTGKRLLEI